MSDPLNKGYGPLFSAELSRRQVLGRDGRLSRVLKWTATILVVGGIVGGVVVIGIAERVGLVVG